MRQAMVLDIEPDPGSNGTRNVAHHQCARRLQRAAHQGAGARDGLSRAHACQIRIRARARLVVYTAGTAQRWVNVEGYMPGNKVVILGSGDIGMIMARRLTFEGAKVERVLEVMPYLTGLSRNYVQCLLDFDIPCNCATPSSASSAENASSRRSRRRGREMAAIPGTEEIIPCDTLLLSVGLIPRTSSRRKPVSASTRSQVALSSIRGTRPACRVSSPPATSSTSMIW